jgi:hypothetical protein
MKRMRLLKDGEYSRYPFALAEMRSPSSPLGTPEAQPLSRWGIECGPGWRAIVERLLDELETAIVAQSEERRGRHRVIQLKEKFGRLVVYLAGEPTAAMLDAIDQAGRESEATCDVCSAPGRWRERDGWFGSRCAGHEQWSPWQRLD